ncbi:MAG: ABC transporter permease [Actinobacteria bacterium]|nr:ABC transporter permease [Actinomycetota bacterium]
MKAIWIIARQNLLILRHDRAAVLWMVVMPLLYIIVFGNAFKGNNDPAKSRAYLAIYAQDKGLLTERLLRSLKSDNIYLDTLSVLPEKLPIRVLTIPDSFTSNILAGHPVTLTLTYRADANVESKMTVVMAVRKAYFRLLADLADLNVHDQKINRNNFVRLDRREPLIKVKKEFAGRAKIIPTGFNHQIPANIVMFTMLVVFLYAGHSLIDEKRAGLLRRIKIAPVSFEQLFLGKLLGITLVGLIQVGILLFLGRYLFSVNYGNAPVSLILLVILFSVTIAAMALCIGMLINNEEKLVGLSITLALLLAALSGCWFPLEIAPAWLNTFANFLPSGLAMKAFHRLISFGFGFERIWPYLAGLAGFSLFFILLSERLLRRQT